MAKSKWEPQPDDKELLAELDEKGCAKSAGRQRGLE